MTVDQPGRVQKQKPPSSSSGRAGMPRVLLIEDDDGMREMLAEALERKGCQVIQCADAFPWLQRCIRQASAENSSGCQDWESCDVIVSDIRMPHMSGLDVLRILRDIGCNHVCPPTIFITAFGDEETHIRARELGAVMVLDKPFPVKKLVDQVLRVAEMQEPQTWPTPPPGRRGAT